MKQKLLYIIMFIATLAWSSGVWGEVRPKITVVDFNNSTSYSDDGLGNNISDGKFSNVINHVTFEFYGGNSISYGGTLKLDLGGVNRDGKNFYFKWTADANYSVVVTKIDMKIRGYGTGSQAKAALNNGTSTTNCGSLIVDWTSLSTQNVSGLPNPVRLYTVTSTKDNRSFYTNGFTFTYKVTHLELDLQDLDAAISAANTLKSSCNTTLQDYLTTAITNADRNGFLFPTYISNSKTPTHVDNATNKLNAVTTFVSKLKATSAFEESKVPNAVYTLLHAHDGVDPNEQSAATLNTWSDDLQSAIEMANATTSDYQAALITITTAKTNSANNNPADVAASDISTAETALEKATSTQDISDALANIKNFDTITFKSELPTTIYTGESLSDIASATSKRTLAYSSSNTTALSVRGTTLNALEPGNVTVTATTGSTGNGYYECKKTRQFTVLPVFYFSVEVYSSNSDLGTASVSYNSEVKGTVNDKSGSSTAVYTATPKNDCVFLGWYTSDTYSGTPISTETTYTETKVNDVYASTVEFSTLYALFKKKHNLQWVEEDVDLNLVLGATGYSSAASVTSGKTIIYESSNDKALTIDTNGAITTVGQGKSTVTAKVAGDEIYREEILTRDFNVDEKKQAAFKPAWWTDTYTPLNTDIKVGTSTTITLYNIATDETSFTITSDPNPTNVIHWSRNDNTLTIYGDVAGTANLTLKQVGDTYLNGSEVTFTITVSKYANTLALAEENNTMEKGGTWQNVITNTGNGNPINVSCDPTGIATYSPENNGTITANAVGNTVFTFMQAETDTKAGAEIKLNLTVTKKANTLSISPFPLNMEVDGTIELEFKDKNSPAPVTASITDTHLSSTIHEGDDVLSYSNGVITAKNAGTAKIKFTQAATDDYEGFESTVYEMTVSKKNNAIAITLDGEAKSSKNVARESQVALGYSSDSEGTYHVALTTGSDDIATLSGNTIIAGNSDGVNIWTITQDETYNYKPATATVRIKVNTIAEAEGYVYTGWTGANEEKDWSTISGTGALALNGPAEFFTFQAKATDIMWVWSSDYFYAQYSTDGGSNWTTALNINLPKKDQWYDFSCEIPENATHVRILTETGAVGNKQVRNVRVSRRTYVRANATTTDLGDIYTDETASTTFTIDYSSTNGGDLEIISNNSSFTVSPTAVIVPVVTNGCDNRGNPKTITVTYTPNPNQLNDEATITVSDRYNSADLTFTAKAKKYSTTIKRGSNTETTTAVYGTIENVFDFSGTSAAYPSPSSSADFYYAISNTPSDVEVISYDPENNTITGVNGGTARLTIYQKATKLYAATNQTFEFAVTKLENGTIINLSNKSLNVDGTATIALTDNASQGDITVEFSNINYTNPAQNRTGGLLSYSNGVLTGVNAGTGKVTVTQAETSKYLSKSVTFDVSVNKLLQTLTWDDPDFETSLQMGTTVSGNTAKSNVGLTPVTYSSGNTDCITVNATTGVLTAVEKGSNVAITASQVGNYKYAAATLTRHFSVFNKKTPAFSADSHFSGSTGQIELEGTATITVTGVSTGTDFSISGYDNTVISVVQDGETITITGLKLGSTTLKLEQEGNDDYIGKSQTYNITVFWPDYYLTLASDEAPTHAAGNYKKIFFTRSLKKGYSTIALPFTTTVAALTGRAANADDWVAQLSAVTKSAADGYTLYFQKVEGGTITANQPYILHLGSAVENPTWTDMTDGITVVAATAGENTAQTGYSDFSDWVMKANYSPNCDMEGKYGVVNAAGTEGALKKGGAGSTLKAYTAYIIYNGAAPTQVKTAYLDEDEADGLLELIRNEQNEVADQQIYDLQGRKLAREQRGINIVVRKDGKVAKVLSAF